MGLRERKKARTRDAISGAAIALFLERGYDAVSVAEIAEAAEVSKRTLFAYFPAKHDLVLHRFADHEDEPARVVRDREPGVAPLEALRRYLRGALDKRDPITGLCRPPERAPVLPAAARHPDADRGVGALPGAWRGGAGPGVDTTEERPCLAARLAAGQILVVLRTLAHENQVRLAAGQSADDLAATAITEAEEAFALLATGLAPYRGSRPSGGRP